MRELQQHASAWVRRAAAGEELEVTDRGRPVARLGPVPKAERGLAALERAGRLVRAKRPLGSTDPLPAVPGEPPLSALLEAFRETER